MYLKLSKKRKGHYHPPEILFCNSAILFYICCKRTHYTYICYKLYTLIFIAETSWTLFFLDHCVVHPVISIPFSNCYSVLDNTTTCILIADMLQPFFVFWATYFHSNNLRNFQSMGWLETYARSTFPQQLLHFGYLYFCFLKCSTWKKYSIWNSWSYEFY